MHVLDNSGLLNPSVFIPYCSFGSNMDQMGTKNVNFTFSVCKAFKPRLFQGQKCYELDMDDTKFKYMSGQGKEKGLSFLVDYNEEKDLTVAKEAKFPVYSGGFHKDGVSYNGIKIYIGSLKPFIGYGPGNYELNSVKMIQGTEDYYKFGEKNDICQTKENLLSCMERVFVEEVTMACGCLPYEMQDLLQTEVTSNP